MPDTVPPYEASDFIDPRQILPRLQTYQEAGLSVCLVGPPGVGKTTAVYAAAGGRENVRTAMGSELQLSDLLGRMTLRGDTTVWQDGLLVEALREGLTFYADGLLGFSEDCLRAMHSAIDFRRDLIVPGNSQTVSAHPNFRFIASCNRQPTGIDPLSREFRDRLVYIYVDRLDSEGEAKLLIDRHGITAEDADWLLSFAQVTRKLDPVEGASTRQLEAAAIAIRAGVDREHAVRDCVLAPVAGASESHREAIRNAIRGERLEINETWERLASGDEDPGIFMADRRWDER